MQGLLDFIKTPEGQGLLAGAFGYAANAQRGAPINSIGRGGLAGLLGYSNALERQDQQAENQFQRQYRNMQMDQMRGQLERQRAQDDWRKNLPTIMGQSQTTYGAGDEGPTVNRGNPQALQEYLMRPESPFADDLIKRQLFPKEEEAYTLGEGQVRYKGGQVIAQGPEKKEATPAEIRGYELAQSQGFKGSFFDYQSALKRAGANQTSIINTQERAESKAVGEYYGGSYADIQKAGMNATSKINRYDRLGTLLEGVSTGKLTPLGLEVAKTAESLGIKIDPSLPNKEAAQALSSEIALELRNPSGGAGMPGAMSDSDRQFLVSMVPGLATTPEGRKMMLETARKLAQRDQEVASLARQYRARNGSIDEGFYDQLATWSAQKPLFQQKSIMRQEQPKPSSGGAPRFLGFE